MNRLLLTVRSCPDDFDNLEIGSGKIEVGSRTVSFIARLSVPAWQKRFVDIVLGFGCAESDPWE